MSYYTRLKKGMTMTFLNTYQWEIFITLEVASWLCLLLFGLLRYVFDKRQMSIAFIVSFIVLIALEGLVGLLIYQETGVISNFQIIVLIFVAYAATFGISDFKKLDRWMRDRKSTRLNSSHVAISYAVFCLKKKNTADPKK